MLYFIFILSIIPHYYYYFHYFLLLLSAISLQTQITVAVESLYFPTRQDERAGIHPGPRRLLDRNPLPQRHVKDRLMSSLLASTMQLLYQHEGITLSALVPHQ